MLTGTMYILYHDMATHSLSIFFIFPVISVIFRQYSSSLWMPNVSQSTTLAGVGVEFPTKHRMALPENINTLSYFIQPNSFFSIKGRKIHLCEFLTKKSFK